MSSFFSSLWYHGEAHTGVNRQKKPKSPHFGTFKTRTTAGIENVVSAKYADGDRLSFRSMPHIGILQKHTGKKASFSLFSGLCLRLILIGELFPHNFACLETLEICIKIRRRSVTMREILQKQKIRFVNFHLSGKKKIWEIWELEKLHEKNVKTMGGEKTLR